MKVLHINSYYSTSPFYKNLFEKQIESGIDIDVFVPVAYTFKKREFDYGKYTLISKNHSKYHRVIFHLKHSKIYKDILERYNVEDYSLIHAHSLFSNGYIALKLKRKFGIPYIVAVRNTDINIFFKKIIYLRKLGLEILKEAEQIIFLSRTYKEQVIKRYVPENLKEEICNKISIIPNGIDKFWFDNEGGKKHILDKSLRLLYVGAVNKNKNIIATVRAISLLQQEGYHVKYSIVGKIEDKCIYNQIKNIPWINYISPMKKEELISIYRDNDIFVMPSIHETFGLVYAEAMSQGLPVIYTKEQGFDGQFKEGEVGYPVECKNYKSLAQKICGIVNDYDAITYNCLIKYNKFDWESISREYENIYNKILLI